MSASLIVLLEHSSACCEDRCMRGGECKDMKQLIHHTLLCKVTACKVCLEVKEYIQSHSARCTAPVCPVITCNAWRQYSNERDRRNSTLSSYSNDISVLQNLRTKTRATTGTQPKVRGTYQCGRCGMPKIRPHKCGEDPSCQITKSSSSSEETTPVMSPRELAKPTLSAEPVIEPGEFSFRSRRTTQARSLISDSSLTGSCSFDSAEGLPVFPPRRQLAAAKSLDSVEFSTALRGLPPQPSSPSRPPTSASPGRSLSQSVDSPLRQTIPAGPQQVISLVRKSSYGTDNNSAGRFGSIGNFPSFASGSSDADDSSASSYRKRVLSPKAADASSRRREEVHRPRLASVPVESAAPSEETAPAAEETALQVQTSGVDESEAAMIVTPSPSALRGSSETQAARYRSQDPESENSRLSTASDLSDESSEDDGAREVSAGAATLTIGDCVTRFPTAFPMWGAGPHQDALPPGVQMMPFYTTVDQYGRQVMVPCWMPPSPSSSAYAGPGGLVHAAPVVKAARKPRTRTPTLTEETNTANTANIVSPGKQPRQPRQPAKYPRRKRTTETPVNTATDSAISSADADPLETFSTLETLVSGEMDASLDGDLDVLALELSAGFVLHPSTRPYCDEDEEDLFRYLDDDMVTAF